ncbi:MAG TPA: GNAT family N-acetyltransferase [Solirubrobacteraceae bacterium]|nr:GNAT family N-acetyltransferase [Solirubrobacteraceae bacterium]
MSSRPLAFPASQSLERALEFGRTMLVRTVDEVRPIPAGLVVRTPSLPSVWSGNQLRATEALGFAGLVDLAQEQLPGLGYLDIAFEHQESGPAVEHAFRNASWKVQRDLLMILSSGPDRVVDTGVVIDAGEDEMMDLMGRWYAEDPGPDPMERAQLVEFTRREARVHGDRMLGVRSTDDQLVSMTKLRSDGRTVQIEDVYTVPEARGRGYARAMVSHAVELAREDGAELIFITADDNDWPKLLYARIGFRPVGHVWHFHHE